MCSVEKRGNIFILILMSSNEKDNAHWLNPTLIKSLRSTIADIKSQALSSPESSFALITTATGKFFSNGLDLKWAQERGRSHFEERLYELLELFKELVAELISLPMPTIAAVNGHAAAAGFALALSHDYLLMRKDKGVLYMSEVDIGMTFPGYFNVLFGEKFGWKARREIMMRGMKLKGEQGVRYGAVDEVFEGGEQVVLEGALCLGQGLVNKRFDGEVYAEIRKGLFPQLSRELGLVTKPLIRPRL